MINCGCCDDPNVHYCGGINKFNDVIVGYNGIIFTADGNYIHNANTHFDFWCGLYGRDKVLNETISLFKKSKVRPLEESSLIAGLNFFNHYPFGHLWDTFQSLLQFKNGAPCKLLCNGFHNKSLDYHFSLFRFNSQNRYHIDRTQDFYSVKELIVPQLEMYPAHISKRHFHDIRNTYLSNIKIKENTPKAIFATRTTTRSAINAIDLEKFCISNDIKIVDGSEPFEDLVSYFYNAKLIFGIHGSLLKHCIFSNNARIIEFAPEFRNDHSFKQNSSFVSKNYEIIKRPCNIKFDISIPLDILKGACNEI